MKPEDLQASSMTVFWVAAIIVIFSTLIVFLNIEIEPFQASKFILFPYPENAS